MDIIRNNPSLRDIVQQTGMIAGLCWERGWAERNAGNISINITHLANTATFNQNEDQELTLKTPYPEISSATFLVSATGNRMRDLACDPEKNMLMAHINNKGTGYQLVDLNNKSVKNSRPTSELPTHLGIHQMIARQGSKEKVVIHTHATELVALTQIREFCDEKKLNKLLWGMHPETIVFIPEGVGFVPYVTPGTEQIARETLKALESHKVALWEKHGVFAIGESVFETFDLIDILAKAARIYFLVKSSGHQPEGLSDEQLSVLKDLAANF
jgi:rhamnulose-1-phosphate aldolase